eukprot:m.269197 g.269197  ORF g.269197 m.269197 type:complete len:211 (-) comp17661_c1_seq23:249-881(-)
MQATLQWLGESNATIAASRAAINAAMQGIYALPVSQMTLDQAHALCNSITGTEMTYSIFKDNNIDGGVLIDLEMRDFEELFALEPVGLRHRLVHCIQHAAHESASTLLNTDFEAGLTEMQNWLANQENVSHEHAELLAKAKFDIVTCGDVTTGTLGLAGIPIAARGTLKKLLHDLNLERHETEQAQDHPDLLDKEESALEVPVDGAVTYC